MRRVVIVLVSILAFSVNSVFAGDLREAAHAAAAQAAAAQGSAERGAMPPGLKWSGIGLLIGGGAAVLVGATIKNEDPCDYTAVNDDCDAIGNGFYIFGAALAGTGAVLLGVANAKRERLPTISVQRGRVMVRQRFTF
jgi:hypothetical protein